MISVCIATFNGEKYIYDQIASILEQLGTNDEIVIIDDCSTDRTLEIIGKFRDNRIILHKNPKNLGVVCSFEKAIEKSKGDFIFLSDQDDIWLPNRVKEMEVILGKSKAPLLMANAYIFDEKYVWLKTFFEYRQCHSGFWENLIKNSYIGCCIAFKAELKREILPFPNNIPMHDQWIGLIAELNGGTLLIDKPYIAYRRHMDNVTGMRPGGILSIIKKRANISTAILNYLFRRKI